MGRTFHYSGLKGVRRFDWWKKLEATAAKAEKLQTAKNGVHLYLISKTCSTVPHIPLLAGVSGGFRVSGGFGVSGTTLGAL
jgi:hypothetical protein